MKGLKSAGAGLLVGAVIFFFTIVVFQIVLGPSSTPGLTSLESRAAHLLAEKSTYLAFWTLEVIGMGLVAASAFVVAFRGADHVGAPLGWALYGVGSLANLTMYAFVMGSYFVVAKVAADTTVPYEAALAASFAVFNIANMLAFLGIGIALSSLATENSPLMPKWVALIGGLVCLLTAGAAAYGLATDTNTMMLMAPGVLAGYMMTGYIGFRLMRETAAS